jgi:hypothetical protein
VQRRKRIFLCFLYQFSSRRILVNIHPVLFVVSQAADAVVIKPCLPEGKFVAELFPNAMRTTAFDKLQCAFQSDVRRGRQQEMKVIGHQNKFVQQKVSVSPVAEQTVGE